MGNVLFAVLSYKLTEAESKSPTQTRKIMRDPIFSGESGRINRRFGDTYRWSDMLLNITRLCGLF